MTILSILGGFALLVLGALKDFGGLSDGAVTVVGLVLLALGVLKEWVSMRRDLAPIRARRELRLVVLSPVEKLSESQAFAARLRRDGYGRVSVTRTLSETAGAQVVTIFQPSEAEVATLVTGAREHRAHVCVYTHANLKALFPLLSDSVTAAQSELRLRTDIDTLAGMLR